MASLWMITGGARSGKSSRAEAMATELAGDAVTYVATAEALDAEMADRIAVHRDQRNTAWQTLEAPRDVPAALAKAVHRVVLIDCLTLYVSNHLLAAGEARVRAAVADLAEAIAQAPGTVILVTNEVGWSVVPPNKLARQFRDLQGWANATLMDQAERGWLAVAGQVIPLK